jgi:hypothetical protein
MAIWEKQYALLAEALRARGIELEGVKDRLKKQVIELPS